MTNTDEEFFTAWFSHYFSRKLKLSCGVLSHDFPAVASTFHVQPVGFCRSCDLLTDSSRRLTSDLLCKYLNEKALRFKFEVFCGRIFFQNKGSLKTFKCFISRYRFFIRILHEFKFMEVTRLPYTGLGLNSYVVAGNYEMLFKIKFRSLADTKAFEPEIAFYYFCCEGL